MSLRDKDDDLNKANFQNKWLQKSRWVLQRSQVLDADAPPTFFHSGHATWDTPLTSPEINFFVCKTVIARAVCSFVFKGGMRHQGWDWLHCSWCQYRVHSLCLSSVPAAPWGSGGQGSNPLFSKRRQRLRQVRTFPGGPCPLCKLTTTISSRPFSFLSHLSLLFLLHLKV